MAKTVQLRASRDVESVVEKVTEIIERQRSVALRRLGIGSFDEARRESDRYLGTGDYPDVLNMAPPLAARVRSLELLDALGGDLDNNEVADEFLAELRDLLPRACRRPLTEAEMRMVADGMKKQDAEDAAEHAAFLRTVHVRSFAEAMTGE